MEYFLNFVLFCFNTFVNSVKTAGIPRPSAKQMKAGGVSAGYATLRPSQRILQTDIWRMDSLVNTGEWQQQQNNNKVKRSRHESNIGQTSWTAVDLEKRSKTAAQAIAERLLPGGENSPASPLLYVACHPQTWTSFKGLCPLKKINGGPCISLLGWELYTSYPSYGACTGTWLGLFVSLKPLILLKA